jgi:hypothetical protein
MNLEAKILELEKGLIKHKKLIRLTRYPSPRYLAEERIINDIEEAIRFYKVKLEVQKEISKISYQTRIFV